jgi:hypothetical protein
MVLSEDAIWINQERDERDLVSLMVQAGTRKQQQWIFLTVINTCHKLNI